MAKDLSNRGAKVLILCRNITKAQEISKIITSNSENLVKIYQIDLASMKSVKKCAQEILNHETKIDYFVQNAGIMMCPYELTEDTIELQFASNYLGHFLLTELLLPLLKKTAQINPVRIVITSSVAHKVRTQKFYDLSSNIHITF